MISVIIATKNRHGQLVACIRSILRNSYSRFEIIIVDQTDTVLHPNKRSAHRVTYLHRPGTGKSQALNEGIKHSRGNIVAFTDDDCIVSKSWLSAIAEEFRTYPHSAAIYGKTLPYKPELHKKLVCVSVMTRSKTRTIRHPVYHADMIGYGNNMAIKKEVITGLNGFRAWLGPGSLASAAEDAEMSLRMLMHGRTLRYVPTITVYHNRWSSSQELKRIQRAYTRGEMACYGYFHVQGHHFATAIVRRNFRHTTHGITRAVKRILQRPLRSSSWNALYPELRLAFARGIGFSIGVIHSFIDPLRISETALP